VEQINPFEKPLRNGSALDRRDFLVSAAIHGTLLLVLIIAGIIASGRSTIPMGGGEFISVQMVMLDTGNTSSEAVQEELTNPVEETQEMNFLEEVVEILEEMPVEEIPVEEIPVEENPVEETPVEETPVEENPVQENPVEETPVVSSQFIGVGSQGEAGAGAPGPASYEGRVFSAIRRNFRTSVIPSRSYRISFTVNLDGTHSYGVIRESGDSSFDRAVIHALNSASIPPIPPGRTQPVEMNIEFFGPESE